jgi:hypothetical protein
MAEVNAISLRSALSEQVLPPWTPDRSPPVESDGDEQSARQQWQQQPSAAASAQPVVP